MPPPTGEQPCWISYQLECVITLTDPWLRQLRLQARVTLEPDGLSYAEFIPLTRQPGILEWIAAKLLETLGEIQESETGAQAIGPRQGHYGSGLVVTQFSTHGLTDLETLLGALQAWCACVTAGLGEITSIERQQPVVLHLRRAKGQDLDQRIDAILAGRIDPGATRRPGSKKRKPASQD